jgi:hypothetical protein
VDGSIQQSIKNMENLKLGFVLRLGASLKRLWFEVPQNTDALRLFETLCAKINEIDTTLLDWQAFAQQVEQDFALNGFKRIAR